MANQLPRPELRAVLGIGSPHGDDCVGWSAVELLRGRLDSSILLQAVSTPSQILDHLDGVTQLVIIDACRGNLPCGTVVQCSWPQHPAIVGMKFASSHDLNLIEALKLAETLGRLPCQVTIVLMEIGAAAPESKMSASVLKALPELMRAVVQVMETSSSVMTLNVAGETGR